MTIGYNRPPEIEQTATSDAHTINSTVFLAARSVTSEIPQSYDPSARLMNLLRIVPTDRLGATTGSRATRQAAVGFRRLDSPGNQS